MMKYILALSSIVAGIVCLSLSRSAKYYGSIEKKYGEAAARKMTNSLRNWGYFLLITSGVLILALVIEGAR